MNEKSNFGLYLKKFTFKYVNYVFFKVQTMQQSHSPLPEPMHDSPMPDSPMPDSPMPDSPVMNDQQHATVSNNNEPIIFQNDDIKFYLVRDYLKRQKIFRLEDHLYLLKAEVKKKRAPLVTSILQLLKEALEFMISTLKQEYKPGKRYSKNTFVCFSLIIQLEIL